MKKVILSLSGIVMAAFMVVMIANAQENPQEVKKAGTAVSKDCGKGPSTTPCSAKVEAKCDPAKCKDEKCEAAACKTACAESKCAAKKCDEAATKQCAKK
jgi:hypothetical protein